MRAIGPLCLCGVIGAVAAAQQPPPASPPPLVLVRPIDPPATPLPSEAASAGVTTVLVHRVRRHAQRRRGRRSGRRADRPGGAQPRGRPDDRAHSRERVDTIPDPFCPAIGRCGAARSERRDVERQLLAGHRAAHARGEHSVLLLSRQSRRDDDATWRSGSRAGIAERADCDVETDSVGGIAASPERLPDVHIRLWERVLHRARLEHRQRLVPAGLGVGSARAPRSLAVPARGRLLSSPGFFCGAAWRCVGGTCAWHRHESARIGSSRRRSPSGPSTCPCSASITYGC